MKTQVLFWLVLLLPSPGYGQFIDIHMSATIIVHPTTGARPNNITPQTITNAVAAANAWRTNYQRGYRYRISELADIGGPSEGGSNGPSKWFGRTFRTGTNWTAFYADAQADNRYRLRSDQVNVWVATGFAAAGNSGGAMPIPPGGVATPGGQIFADDGPWWVVHELGHFFGLLHTHNGQSTKSITPGDDGLADTLPDHTYWTNVNMVAQYHYSANYNALSPWQQQQVDNVYFNTMSYHEAVNKNTVEDRRTEQQLDRETDHANGDRHGFVAGYTRYVDHSGIDFFCGLSSAAPKRTVLDAAQSSAIGGGDIILIRPGNYNEHITINRPVTLRSPRTGWATIGKP